MKRQLVGVFSRHWIEPLAQVLNNLGSDSVWVVHGSDGLDEITTSGPTHVAALENGKVRTFEIKPEDIGLKPVKPESLRGADADTNAAALKAVLDNKDGAYRDVAMMNAAAALVVAQAAKDLKEGAALARKALDIRRRTRRGSINSSLFQTAEAASPWPTSSKRSKAINAKRSQPQRRRGRSPSVASRYQDSRQAARLSVGD